MLTVRNTGYQNYSSFVKSNSDNKNTTGKNIDNVSFGLRAKFLNGKGYKEHSKILSEFNNLINVYIPEFLKKNNFRQEPKSLLEGDFLPKTISVIKDFKAQVTDAKGIIIGLGNPSHVDKLSGLPLLKGFSSEDILLNLLGQDANKFERSKSFKKILNLQDLEEKDKKVLAGVLDKMENYQAIVYSASGTTKETVEQTRNLRKIYEYLYKQCGNSENQIEQNVAKHFLFVTNKSDGNTLLKEAGNKLHNIIPAPEGHSGSIFLGYYIPSLLYAGKTKGDIKAILKSTVATYDKYLKPSNKTVNSPLYKLFGFFRNNPSERMYLMQYGRGTEGYADIMNQGYCEEARRNIHRLDGFVDAHAGGVQLNLRDPKKTTLINIINENSNNFVENSIRQAHVENAKDNEVAQMNIYFSPSKPKDMGELIALTNLTKLILAKLNKIEVAKITDIAEVKPYKAIQKSIEENATGIIQK